MHHEKKSPKIFARATHLSWGKNTHRIYAEIEFRPTPHSHWQDTPRSELINLRGPSALAPPIHIFSVTTLSKTKTFDNDFYFLFRYYLLSYFLLFFSLAPIGHFSRLPRL